MGYFDTLFGNSNDNRPPDFWKIISSESDWEAAIKESFVRTVVVFKHSTRCFISKTVLKNFEKEISTTDRDISFYFLDLLAHRAISDKIAEEMNVPHQSPQIIVLRNGKAVNSASHQSISLSIV